MALPRISDWRTRAIEQMFKPRAAGNVVGIQPVTFRLEYGLVVLLQIVCMFCDDNHRQKRLSVKNGDFSYSEQQLD